MPDSEPLSISADGMTMQDIKDLSPKPETAGPADTKRTENVEDTEGSEREKQSIQDQSENSDNGDSAINANSNDKQTRKIQGFKWFLVCISLYISALVFGLDTTIAADVQSSVVETFGHVDQLAWIGAGFPLGSVGVVLPVGMLFTRFNMKWVYIFSLALFELGSCVCGAAPNMDAIIIGRVIAGAGGAGLFLGCLNYFSAVTAPSERGFYISLIGLCWGGGSVLGPVIGGAFAASSATWRWAFYINLVIAAITCPVYLFYLPSLHLLTGKSIRERIVDLDLIGYLLHAVMWVTFAMAATMAGGQWPWNDGRNIATWIVFGVLLISYISQQYFCILTTSKTRSFPLHLLASRTQLLLSIATAANNAAAFCIIYFIPIYFQFVHGDGPLIAAVRLLPYITLSVFTNIALGRFLPRIQYYMPLYVTSGVLTVITGGLLIGCLKPSTSEGTIYGLLVVLGIGTGLTLTMGFSIATIKADTHDVGNAISLQDLCQLGATVITLVIAGQVFQSRAVANLGRMLAGEGFASADIRGAVAGAQSTLFTELSGALKDSATNAITDAMQRTLSLTVVAGGILILAGSLMRFEKLFDASEGSDGEHAGQEA